MQLPVSFDRLSEIAESDSVSGKFLFEDAIAILVLAGCAKQIMVSNYFVSASPCF